MAVLVLIEEKVWEGVRHRQLEVDCPCDQAETRRRQQGRLLIEAHPNAITTRVRKGQAYPKTSSLQWLTSKCRHPTEGEPSINAKNQNPHWNKRGNCWKDRDKEVNGRPFVEGGVQKGEKKKLKGDGKQ